MRKSRKVRVAFDAGKAKVASARALKRSARRLADGFDEEIAGYVLVAWSQRGDASSTVRPGGMVARDLVPSFVHDVLNRHGAADLVHAGRFEADDD